MAYMTRQFCGFCMPPVCLCTGPTSCTTQTCLDTRCAQYLGDLGADFVVYKNDEVTVEEIRALNPAGVLVSPGPGGSVHVHVHVFACVRAHMHTSSA